MRKAATKSKFQSWGDVTSCHGFPDLINSSSIIAKAFWVFLILSSFSLAAWQIFELLVRFGSSPHYVTHSYSEEAESVPFPNVTVCNINRVNRYRAIKLGMVNESGDLDPDLLNYFFISFPVAYEQTMTGSIIENLRFRNHSFVELNRLKEKYERFLVRANLTTTSQMDIVYKLGYTCEEMIARCKWQNVEFPCCARATPIVNAYGLCYSIPPIPKTGEERAHQRIPGKNISIVHILLVYNPL